MSSRSDKIRAVITQRRSRPQIGHVAPRDDESGSSSRNKSQSPSRNSRTGKPNRSDPFLSSRPKKSTGEDVIGERVRSNAGPLSVTTLPAPNALRSPKRVQQEDPKTLSIDQRTLAGPIAAVEFERLKKELEALKKASTESRKVIKKQNKVIEELKAELNAVKLEKKDHEAQIQTLQTKSKTNDEFITSIEASLQCQICMELLSKPYALSPCGHVLCVGCLQEWFRKAPPSASDDDMDIDMQDDPDYIMHRAKSCPCCRAVILKRPVPVFVVKAITSSLVKAKGSQREISPSPTDEDPWRGLFPDDDESDQDEYDNDDFWSEDEEGLSEAEIGFIPQPFLYHQFDDYYTDEGASEMGEDDPHFMYDEEQISDDEDEGEDEEEPEEYVFPQWAPPAYTVLEPDGSPNRVALFRRGCNNALIDLFGIVYTHSEGLIAHVSSFDEQNLELGGRFNHQRRRRSNRIMLGYNVDLSPYNGDAHAYMIDILRDMKENPDRWNILFRARGLGIRDATRLVSVDEVVDYNTTESEAYL